MSVRQQRVDEARREEITFSEKFQELLKETSRLHFLDSVREVSSWDKELIQSRSRNMVSLAWDHIAPWLGY